MYQGSPSDSYDETVNERPNGVDVSGLEDAVSPHMQLLNQLTNRGLDKKSLDVLRGCNHQTVLRCLQLCWAWCHKEIRNGEPQSPHSFVTPGIDGIDNQYAWSDRLFIELIHHYLGSATFQKQPEWASVKYACDARLFVYLLRRYIGSATIQEHLEWAGMAKTTLAFCPINMLFAMSSLMVTIASATYKEANLMMSLLESDTELDMAELSAQGMELRGELMEAFCDELEENYKDYASYAAAFHSAVRVLKMQNEPETRVNEYSGVAEEGHYAGIWHENLPVKVEEGMVHSAAWW